MTPTYHYLWAKTPSQKDSLDYLPVLYHLLDVGAVVHRLLEREGPRLQQLTAKDLGIPVENVLVWVPALAALHDLGKADPAFQAKWKGHFQQLLLPNTALSEQPTWEDIPHNIVSEALLRKFLPELGFPKFLTRHLADAVGRHHGFQAEQGLLGRADARLEVCPAWLAAQRELFLAVLAACRCNEVAVPLRKALEGGGFMRLAGLVSFADWIGSNQAFFTAVRDGQPARERLDAQPADIFHESLAIADKALDSLQWPPAVASSKSFEEIFGFTPRCLQQVTIELVQEQTEPVLLLVEAPMGEGKTEAALFAHTLLQAMQGSRGLYFALPTQATGNAMFRRVAVDYLARLGVTGVDLQLMHGAALLNEDFERLKFGMEEEVVAREWFSHRKRSLLSPNGVGTIDQALLSVLNVKHQFVRMWGLGRRTIIFDEVHAYELYTHTLLQRLVAWLRAMDCNVILLSATLPNAARRSLVEGFGGRLPDHECAYPRVTRVSQQGSVSRSFAVRASSFGLKSCRADLASMSQLIASLASEGGAVGCVVNTVKRAQHLYRLVKQWLPGRPLLLIHARFPVHRRLALEQRLVGALGKQSQPHERNLVVIATQVVEQSLDLDFDVMITDLAPVDLVLQRSGRLHRHTGRIRPAAFRSPTLYVAGLPEDDALPRLREHGWSYVYDAFTLYRSAWILRQLQGQSVELPLRLQGQGSLVEQCYSEVPLNWPVDWQSTLEESRERLRRELEEHSLLALQAELPAPDKYCSKAPDPIHRAEDDDPQSQHLLMARTRLGDPSLNLLFYERTPRGLQTMGGVPLRLSGDVTLAEAKDWLQETVRVSNPPIVRYFQSDLIKSGWRKNALLRSVVPVQLESGKWASSEYTMELDEELGLLIERESIRGECIHEN